MREKIDMERWPRREIYEHFSRYGDPFCGVTVEVDFTPVYREAKRDGASFYLYYLHLMMRAVDASEPMRLRIERDGVYRYDHVGMAPTVGREDGSIGFAYFPWIEDRKCFIEECRRITALVQSRRGLCFGEMPAESSSAVFFSAVPWLRFTDLKNPFSLRPDDSNPRLSTGRVCEQDGRMRMPVCLQVHHALMDGYHVAAFIGSLETLISRAGE